MNQNEQGLQQGGTVFTNEVRFQFRPDVLEAQYDVFQVECRENSFQYGSRMFDSQLLNKGICSLVCRHEEHRPMNVFYVLMNTDAGNRYALRKTLSPLEQSEDIAIQDVTFQELCGRDPSLVAQLLLNTLGSYTGSLRTSNLTGHFYCFCTEWFDQGKDGFIFRIPTLEIRFTPDNLLLLKVQTFTNSRLRKYITFEKRKFEEYPKYVLSKDTLRRKLNEEKEVYFIPREMDGYRSTIPFLNVEKQKEFHISKVGVLHDVLERFQRKFGDAAVISFVSVENYFSADVRSGHSQMETLRPMVRAYFDRIPLQVVDGVQGVAEGAGRKSKNTLAKEALAEWGDTDSPEDQKEDKKKGTMRDSRHWCEEFVQALKEEYSADVPIGTKLDPNVMNVQLIHNRAYYQDNPDADPHNQVPDGVVVQHITLEDLKPFKTNKSEVRAIIQNLLVKQDLKDGKIQLYDWSSLNLPGDMEFLYCQLDEREDEQDGESDGSEEADHRKKEWEKRYFCMKIAPDGTFRISEETFDVFHPGVYQDCLQIFEDDEDRLVKGIIRFPDGDVNVIRDTPLFTLPNLDEIACRIDAGDAHLRRIGNREMLDAVTDINSFERDGMLYYYVGVIGRGMRDNVQNAARVRELSCAQGSQLHFHLIKNLMNVIFVRNGQLTVYPFPFKYLREYALANR